MCLTVEGFVKRKKWESEERRWRPQGGEPESDHSSIARRRTNDEAPRLTCDVFVNFLRVVDQGLGN